MGALRKTSALKEGGGCKAEEGMSVVAADGRKERIRMSLPSTSHINPFLPSAFPLPSKKS